MFKYNISPEGPPSARVAIVCEKPAGDECKAGRLLVGSSGQLVRWHARSAGLHAGSERPSDLSRDVWLTNAVQSFDEIGNPTNEDLIREQPRLFQELCNLPNLNCIIAMGAKALMSLTNFKLDTIGNWRGSIIPTCFGYKMVPTYHPSFYKRGEERFKPVVQFDVNRAVKESQWPSIIRQTRTWNIRPTYPEAMEWIDYLLNYSTSPYLSFDIESMQGRNHSWYISCIAFAVEPTEAFCIPIMYRDRRAYWPEISTESSIWLKIAELLGQPNKRYVTQNGPGFDCPVLRRHGIRTPYMANGFDTYSAHSLLAPDMPKKLEFITSIHTEEPYYKGESGRGEEFGQVDENQFWVYNCKDAAFTLEAALSMMRDMKEA